MEIQIRRRSDVQLVQLKGHLRLGQPVDDLRRDLEEMLSVGDTRVVLDMSQVPMIDSSGIGLLVKYLTTTKEAGGTLKLINPSDFATKTLKMTGVLNLFEVFHDEEEAINSFQ